ncbi:hypothetical protein V6N11_076900 [Hibiscus sabdariffa]|uniref:RNase H type-1 domain-containing protein n=1 Tax=Hibiscus sabdariffa TaxID=183260 RepID=A0ABR2TBF7_9ROSI
MSLLCRCWEVRMIHVLRSGNSVMDNIAKLAILGSTCVIYFEVPPPSIVHVLLGDVDGVSDNIAKLAILGSTCVIYFENFSHKGLGTTYYDGSVPVVD